MSSISKFLLNVSRSGLNDQIEAKMPDVRGAAVGSIPVFDSHGELVSSEAEIGADPSDVPTTAQVEGIVSTQLLNIPSLPAVQFATTANDTRSGLTARDGYTPVDGALCLVKNQTNGDNGIFKAATGAWVRQRYNGTTYVDVTTQTDYAGLGIDKGVVNVLNGTANKNLQYQIAIKDTTALLGAGSVTVTGVSKLAPRDVFNGKVSRNVGNDTLFNGTPGFPYGSASRALTGASFPCVVKLAPSGGAYNEALTLTAAQSNLEISTDEAATDAGKVSWTQPITLATGNTRFTLKGLTLNTGAAAPIVIQSGNLGRHRFENLIFNGTFTSLIDLASDAMATATATTDKTNWVVLRNLNCDGALYAKLVIPACAAGSDRTYYIYDQASRLAIDFTTGDDGARNNIVMDTSVRTGCVRVPLGFKGTATRFHAYVGKVSGVITDQTALDALIADTAGTDTTPRYYAINGFIPTQGAQLTGAIIGKQSAFNVTECWIERSFDDAPATVMASDGAYMKAGSGWTKIVLSTSAPIVLTGILTAAPTLATPDGLYIQLFGTPPAGCPLGSVFSWVQSTTTATLQSTYVNSPTTYQVGTGASSQCWSKRAGTWAPESITLAGVLTAAPTASNAIGFYTQVSGTATGYALGDIVYWDGTNVLAYLTYANVYDSVTSAGATYVKSASSVWMPLALATGPAVYTGKIEFDVTGATRPTKPTATTRDYITVVDDGSGWCSLTMDFAWEVATGATAGAGIYLVRLPTGAPLIDTNYHKSVTGSAVNLQNFTEVGRAIPGSHGLVSRSDGSAKSLTAFVADATHFFMTPNIAYADYNKIRSDYFQITTGSTSQSYGMAFRYKKV